jgi:hypothetical protein
MSPIPPPRVENDPKRPVTIRLRDSTWKRLDAIVAERPDYSRESLMEFFLTWAMDDYDREKAQLALGDSGESKKHRAPKSR